MRQGSNSRRPRSRGNARRHPSSRGNSVESNGPNVKVRGTAQQVLEKYLSLAHDAFSIGDRVAAEGYYQHADHYYRVVNGDGGSGPYNGKNRGHGAPRTPPAPQGPFGQEAESAPEVTPDDGETEPAST